MLEILCDHFLKNKSFHNFSSVVYILLNKYFCCNVFKKTEFYFDGLPWITFTFLCVYDMMIVLLKLNGETLMKWLGAVLEMLFVCLCLHWDVTRASVYVW